MHRRSQTAGKSQEIKQNGHLIPRVGRTFNYSDTQIEEGDIIWVKRSLEGMKKFLVEYDIANRKTTIDEKASLNGCTLPGEEIYKILEIGTSCKQG